MKNLISAVLKVREEVKSIDKTMEVGTGRASYSGVADKVVKEVIGDAMQKNGLSIFPISIEPTHEVERWEEESEWNGKSQKKNKQSVFTTVSTKYMLCHESGESMVIAGYGHGVDSQDKGAGKATTYALKNTLLYTFMVPTKNIDDTDSTHSNDYSTPNRSKSVKATSPSRTQKLISDAQIKKINILLTDKGKKKEDVYKIYKVESLKDLTISQASNAIERLNKLDSVVIQ